MDLQAIAATALANREAFLADLQRIKCEDSLLEFTRCAWHAIEPAEPLIENWHIEVICCYLEAFFNGHIRRLIINIPPGSLKSVLFSVMGPAWVWTRHPSARMISLTSEAKLATRDNRRMRQVVAGDWYRSLWGDVVKMSRDQDEKTLFETTARGFRQCQGINGAITGKRGNFLLLDDLVDAKKAFSDLVIQGANDTYDQAVASRLNHPATDSIGLIMQRLRTNDLTGHLLAKKATKWTLLKIQQEYTGAPTFDPDADLPPEIAKRCPRDPRKNRGDLLFPSFFTPEVIAEAKENLGNYGWAGQHQQDPSPLGGGILKQKWWRVWGQFGWTKGRKIPEVKHVFASWDTAYSERDLKKNAYSAYTLWGVFWDEDRQRDALLLLGHWYDRVGYDELLDKAKELSKTKLTHESDAHLIERKASGISLIQSMRRNQKLRIRSYAPVAGEDKVARAYMVQPLLQAGCVYVADTERARELVSIVSEFPAGGPPCADLTDTVTQALQYLQRGHWLTHPDDDADDDPVSSVEEDDEDMPTPTRRVGYG